MIEDLKSFRALEDEHDSFRLFSRIEAEVILWIVLLVALVLDALGFFR